MKTSKKKIKMSELKTLDEVKQSFLEKGKEKGQEHRAGKAACHGI